MASRLRGSQLDQQKIDLYASAEFTFDSFKAQAKKNGWDAPDDEEYLKDIYEVARGIIAGIKNKDFSAIDKGGKYYKAFNLLDDIYACSLNDKNACSQDIKHEVKRSLVGDAAEMAEDPYKTRLKNAMNDESKALWNNYMIESAEAEVKEVRGPMQEIWKGEDLNRMLSALNTFKDRNGMYLPKVYETAKANIDYEFSDDPVQAKAERLEIYKKIIDAMDKYFPPGRRTDRQEKFYETLSNEISSFGQEKKDWAKKVSENGYFFPSIWLEPIYALKKVPEVAKNKEHPVNKVIAQIEEGRVPEYPNIKIDANNQRYVDLVTSCIHEHIMEAIKGLEASIEKQAVIDAINVFNGKAEHRKKWVEIQKMYVPFNDAFEKLTGDSQKRIGVLAKKLENTQNQNGSGTSDEFNQMIESMKDFSTEKSRYGGSNIFEKMIKMNDSVNVFIEAEQKLHPENENIHIALAALDVVNPLKAAETRQELAKNLYTNLTDTKKGFFHSFGIDTDEYTKFKNAMEAFSKVKEGDSGYEKAAEDLAKLSREYIGKKKGGISVEASNDRRKLAILAYSLVKPEEAADMVAAANVNRVKKGLRPLDLATLQYEAGFGELKEKPKKKSSKKTAKVKTDLNMSKPPLTGHNN